MRDIALAVAHWARTTTCPRYVTNPERQSACGPISGPASFIVVDLTSVGIGLDYDDLRLSITSDEWVEAGALLRDQITLFLDGVVVAVEQIGSSAVVGLAAKPIIDLAVGIDNNDVLSEVTSKLEAEGWIYRGDAGDDGGHVFVLETRPWFRVAHIHVVEHGGRQWTDYLRLRRVLRSSDDARARYSAVKERLVASGTDRRTYTEQKAQVVRELLSADQP